MTKKKDRDVAPVGFDETKPVGPGNPPRNYWQQPPTAKSADLKKAQGLLELWIANEGLSVLFYPATATRDKRGRLLDFEYECVLGSRKIDDEFVIAVAGTWLLSKGLFYKPETLHQILKNWVFAQYKAQVPDEITERLIDRPRLVFKQKKGRPRKDSSTRTIVITEELAGLRFGARWRRLNPADAKVDDTKESDE